MKLLRRLLKGKSETLVELPPNIHALDVLGDMVYFTDPENGQIHQWDGKDLSVLAVGLFGVRGIYCSDGLIFSENPQYKFFFLRPFDRIVSPLMGDRTSTILGATHHETPTQHPRINGLHVDTSSRRVFFAYPERHFIYCIDGGHVHRIGGTGQAGFSIGPNGSGSMNYPSDIAVIGNRLFVSDTANHIIREFTVNGMNHTRFIGHPLQSGQLDEIGAQARLCHPTELSLRNNTLYFLDDYDSIRSVELKSLIVNTLLRNPNRIEAMSAGENGAVFFIESAK